MEKVYVSRAFALARQMELAYLNTSLAVQGGKFTFLPEERPGATVEIDGCAHNVRVISLEISDGYDDEDVYLKCLTRDGKEPILSNERFFAGELIHVADTIPAEKIDYEAAEADWKAFAGTYEIGGGSDPVVIDDKEHTIYPDGYPGQLSGTEAYLELARIRRSVDEGYDIAYVLKKTSESKGFDLPF